MDEERNPLRRLGRHEVAVLAALRGTPRHPTAAEVYAAVRARWPHVGRATIYRALARLEAAGLATEIGRDASGRHYDARTERHDHAICVACGAVFDLAGPVAALPPAVLAPLARAARGAGLRGVASYEVRLYGRCAACQAAADATADARASELGARMEGCSR